MKAARRLLKQLRGWLWPELPVLRLELSEAEIWEDLAWGRDG